MTGNQPTHNTKKLEWYKWHGHCKDHKLSSCQKTPSGYDCRNSERKCNGDHLNPSNPVNALLPWLCNGHTCVSVSRMQTDGQTDSWTERRTCNCRGTLALSLLFFSLPLYGLRCVSGIHARVTSLSRNTT